MFRALLNYTPERQQTQQATAENKGQTQGGEHRITGASCSLALVREPAGGGVRPRAAFTIPTQECCIHCSSTGTSSWGLKKKTKHDPL